MVWHILWKFQIREQSIFFFKFPILQCFRIKGEPNKVIWHFQCDICATFNLLSFVPLFKGLCICLFVRLTNMIPHWRFLCVRENASIFLSLFLYLNISNASFCENKKMILVKWLPHFGLHFKAVDFLSIFIGLRFFLDISLFKTISDHLP